MLAVKTFLYVLYIKMAPITDTINARWTFYFGEYRGVLVGMLGTVMDQDLGHKKLT